MELALITLPVGMNLYVVQGIRGHGAVSDLFIGIMPFVAIIAVCTHYYRVSCISHMVAAIDVLMRFLIVNPNTSETTNRRLRHAAISLLDHNDDLEVISAPPGVSLSKHQSNPQKLCPM